MMKGNATSKPLELEMILGDIKEFDKRLSFKKEIILDEIADLIVSTYNRIMKKNLSDSMTFFFNDDIIDDIIDVVNDKYNYPIYSDNGGKTDKIDVIGFTDLFIKKVCGVVPSITKSECVRDKFFTVDENTLNRIAILKWTRVDVNHIGETMLPRAWYNNANTVISVNRFLTLLYLLNDTINTPQTHLIGENRLKLIGDNRVSSAKIEEYYYALLSALQTKLKASLGFNPSVVEFRFLEKETYAMGFDNGGVDITGNATIIISAK